MNNVSIVILNFNGEKLLSQFLPSVVAKSSSSKIIVVDNGSTDSSVEFVQANFPSVQIIQLEENYGFCGGYNRALQHVKSEYYVLLNSDVEVTEGWLDPLISLLEKNKTIATVQPKILSYKQKDYFEYAGAGGGFIDSFGYPFCRGRLFDFLEKDTGQYDDTREVFWASGACLVIRSEIFHSLGGFDETFFAHMEEIDLCWRIQRSGSKVFYCGASKVYHLGAGTLSRSNPRKTYYNFRNGLALIYKHFKPSQLVWRFPIRLFLDYLAAIKFVIIGHGKDAKAVLKAHYDFFADLKIVRTNRKELNKSYPYSTANMHNGLIPLFYYILGRRRIDVKSPK